MDYKAQFERKRAAPGDELLVGLDTESTRRTQPKTEKEALEEATSIKDVSFHFLSFFSFLFILSLAN